MLSEQRVSHTTHLNSVTKSQWNSAYFIQRDDSLLKREEWKWSEERGKKEFIQLNFEYLKLKNSWNDGYTFYVWWFVWCRKRVRFHRNYNSSRLWIASLKCHVSRQTNSKGLRCLFYDSSFFFYLISQLLNGHAIMLAYFILN